MNNSPDRNAFKKTLPINLILICGVFVMLVLGCNIGSKSNSKPIPSDYYGAWTGNDGSTISIRGDGSGDYRSGNFKVEGGTAEISEDGKSISITFFGIGKTLKIDQAPSGGTMKLEGVVYLKSGGSTSPKETPADSKSSSSSDSNSNATNPFGDKSLDSSDAKSAGNVPGDSELKTMVHNSLRDFTDAIESEDFTDFRETTSKGFQNEYSAIKMKSTFGVFVAQKEKVVPVMRSGESVEPSFSPAPNIASGVLNVGGTISGRQTITFELKYVKEADGWKVNWIRVKL